MYDFLSFNTFITQKVLVIFYYIGAIGIPLIMLMYRKTFVTKFSFLTTIELWLQTLFNSLKRKDKIVAIIGIVILFLFMELIWRMMFEAMIGYFDMHDYLQQLSQLKL